MSLDLDTVKKVATLGRLTLAPAEQERMRVQLGAILDYVEKLRAVDTAGVEPMAHCLPIQNVFRDDVPGVSLPVDAALANAPKRVGDFYSVPPVLDND